jgi:hypothetical protein
MSEDKYEWKEPKCKGFPLGDFDDWLRGKGRYSEVSSSAIKEDKQ